MENSRGTRAMDDDDDSSQSNSVSDQSSQPKAQNRGIGSTGAWRRPKASTPESDSSDSNSSTTTDSNQKQGTGSSSHPTTDITSSEPVAKPLPTLQKVEERRRVSVVNKEETNSQQEEGKEWMPTKKDGLGLVAPSTELLAPISGPNPTVSSPKLDPPTGKVSGGYVRVGISQHQQVTNTLNLRRIATPPVVEMFLVFYLRFR
jgi:hypothetical protein